MVRWEIRALNMWTARVLTLSTQRHPSGRNCRWNKKTQRRNKDFRININSLLRHMNESMLKVSDGVCRYIYRSMNYLWLTFAAKSFQATFDFILYRVGEVCRVSLIFTIRWSFRFLCKNSTGIKKQLRHNELFKERCCRCLKTFQLLTECAESSWIHKNQNLNNYST